LDSRSLEELKCDPDFSVNAADAIVTVVSPLRLSAEA
jgi:hypothetical protein